MKFEVLEHPKKRIVLLVLLGIVFLSISVMLIIPKKSNAFTFNENRKIEDMISEILKENADLNLITQNVVDQKIINLVFAGEDQVFKSYQLNVKNGHNLVLDEIVKREALEHFENKVKELLLLKYPEFVVDGILLENTKRTYDIRENQMIIYFSNVITDPVMEQSSFSIVVNYNEIKDDLNFSPVLDPFYENEDGYHYDKNKKTVALTFDDGPNGSKTKELLTILSSNRAHASFFMVGNRMESGKEIMKQVLSYGNEIGSHSYDHKNLKRSSIETVIETESKTNEIYKSITGEDLTLLRAPYGAITTQIRESLDVVFASWSVDPEDWRYRDSEIIVSHIMEHVKDGDVILLHDSYQTSVDAVRKLLPLLYAEGYQVVSFSELASIKGVSLEKHKSYRSF